MHKGIFKTAYKFIMFVVLFMIAIFTLDPIAKLIGSINLSSFISVKTIIYTNTDAGVSYNVTISSLYHTLQESIKGLYFIYGISSSYSEATTLSISLADSLIKLISFLIDTILIMTLGYLFIILTYHLIFKHLIPKIARRKLKMKIPSFIIGGVNFILIWTMFLSPLSSIVNIVNQNYQKTKSENDSEIVKTMGTYIDAYNNSIIANLFFNWTVNDDGFTIDTQLMHYITSTVTENIGISIYGEIDNLMGVATTIGNAIVVDENGNISQGLNYLYLLSQGVLENLFSTLKGSNLFIYLIPIAYSFASNIPLLSSYLDTNLIEDDSIDWEKEFDIIETVSIDLINTGLVDIFVDKENNSFNFTLTDEKINEIIATLLSDDNFGNVYRVLNSIDESKLLKNLFPVFIYQLVSSNVALGGIIPNSFDELKEISWGFELATTYNSLYELNKVDDTLIPYIVSLMNNNPESKSLIRKAEGEETNNNLIADIISKLLKHPAKYIDVLIGDVDKNGNLTNIDENGYTKVKSMKDYRLLDLKIVKNLMKFAFNALISSFSNTEMDTTKIENAIKEIFSSCPIKNIKNELLKVINILSSFDDTDYLINVLTGQEALVPDGGTIADIDDKLIDSLVVALPIMENSILLKNTVFPMIESTFKQEGTKDTFASIGLDVSNFDFEAENIGQEYASILKLFDSIKVILNIISSSSSDINSLVSSLSENHFHLAKLLDGIYNSQIFNPISNNDENFYSVIDYIFSDLINMTGLSFKKDLLPANLKWNNSQNKNGDYYRDQNGEIIYDGEIGAIINIIKVIGENNILEPLGDFSSIQNNIGVLETTYHISDLFYSIDDSKVFSLTMGDFLDTVLETTGLIDDEIGMTFNNVISWKHEGDTFKGALKIIDELQIDLSNIDISKIKDVVSLNNLLHYLSDSNLFVNKSNNEYLFPKFLENKLMDSLSNLGEFDLLADPDGTNHEIFKQALASLSDKEEWNYSGYIFDFDKSQYINDEYVNYYDNPLFTDDYDDIMSMDEIGRIVRVVHSLKNVNDLNKILDLKTETIEDILISINKTTTLDIALYNIYGMAKSYGQAYFSLDNMNHIYLLGHSEEENKIEIGYLCDLINLVKTIKNNSNLNISSGTINIEAIDDDFVNNAKTALKSMNKSYIFHRYNVATDEFTVFQNVVDLVMNNDILKSSIYDSNSPKDIKLGTIDNKYGSDTEKIKYLITNVFPSGSSSNFINQETEIDNIFEVINSFIGGNKENSSVRYNGLVDSTGNRVYSLDDVDFKNANNITGIKDIISNLNNSDLLMDCAVNYTVSTFNEVSSNISSSFSYLKISEANLYYHYDNHNNTFNFDNKLASTDIDLLILLLEDVNKFLNNDISAIPNFTDLSKLDFSGFGGLLDEFAESNIFHRGGPKYTINPVSGEKEIISTEETTVFQQLYIEFLNLEGIKNYYYKSSSPKDIHFSSNYTDASTKSIYNIKNTLDYTKDSSYILTQNSYLEELLRAILGEEKSDGTGTYPGISSDMSSSSLNLSDINIDKLNPEGFTDVLKIINQSDIFFDIAPNLVDDIMQKIDDKISDPSSSANIQYIKFEYVNSYYQYSNGYDERYVSSDFQFLNELLEIGKDFLSDSGNSLLEKDLLNADDMTITQLKDLMKYSNISNIGHRGGLKEGKDFTFFQSLFKEFLSTDLIKNSIFNTDSKVDKYYSDPARNVYTTSEEKIDFLIKTKLSFDPNSNSESLNFIEQAGTIDSFDIIDESGNVSRGDYGEIGNIADVIISLRPLSGSSFDFSLIDLSELSGSVITNIFTSFINTNLIYDCVPNILSDIFTNIDTNSPSLLEGIKFSDASVYYYLTSPTDYNQKFEEDEIVNVGNLLDNYNQLVSLIADYSLSSSDFSNISSFNPNVINCMNALAKDMYKSNMLHKSNQYLLSNDKLTVFEQYINSLITQSTLVDLNFNSNNPYDSSYTDAKDKLVKLIKSMSKEDMDNNNSYEFRVHKHWCGDGQEIDSLFDFFETAAHVLNGQSSTISNISFDSISPNDMESFLVSLNASDIICDVVNKFVNDGLDNVGLSQLAKINISGEEKIYLNRYLTQLEYRESEIDTLISMLRSISVYDGGNFTGYSDISNTSEFVNKHSLKDVFDFLTTSKFLNIPPFASDEKIGRDIVTFNIFDKSNFSQYISGSNVLEKINVINAIYSFVDTTEGGVSYNGFNTEYEGNALTMLINKSSNIGSINPSGGIDTIKDNKDLVLEVFKICYEKEDGNKARSYFASEVVGNLIEKALEKEYDEISSKSYSYEIVNLTPYDLNDIKNSDYKLFNEYEYNGLKGSLSMCDLIDSSIKKSDSEKVKENFALMGKYDSTGKVNDGYGNSKIALICYLSKIDPLLLTMHNNPLDPFNGYTNEVYDSSFCFELYGEVIANYINSSSFIPD